HRRRYGDSSLLIELFSDSEGRVAVIAKGAMSGRAPRAALLQPFVPLLADWRGRGEVKSLRQVEAAGAALPLRGRALYCGFYVNELLVRLAQRQDPQLLLFARYGQVLSELAAGGDPDTALRRFELTLLQALGSAAELAVEADGRTPVRAEGRYRVEPEAGPVSTSQGDPGGVSGDTLLRLAAGEELAGECRREARQLLRGILAHHLGDRPLKSRELFRTLQPEKS
ncbi:MAG: DNA repair protein RecO, partial [Anaerolineae bacterium]